MLLVYGHPAGQVLKLWQFFEVKAIMLNAFQIAKIKSLMKRVEEVGLREAFGIPEEVEVWLDSGGYQALRRGVKLSPETVERWYSAMKPDYCVSLDLPVGPGDKDVEKKVETNIANAKYLEKRVPCSLLPVYHPVPDELFQRYLEGYSEVGERVAVGGLVPRILTVKGAKRREGWEFLAKVRREERRWLHALGLGSALLIPKLKELGYQSADTQTWRHKAAYGKIMLPGKGERHITGRKINFGKKKISDEEKVIAVQLAKKLNIGWDELVNDFKKRAIFNAYVLNVVVRGSV